MAGNFTQLLLSRAGVGIAEAGCTPPAHSLISDYFEPSRRTSALSVYSSGISVGYLVAALAGGYVAQHYGWRAACAIVGLPGIALAIVLIVALPLLTHYALARHKPRKLKRLYQGLGEATAALEQESRQRL